MFTMETYESLRQASSKDEYVFAKVSDRTRLQAIALYGGDGTPYQSRGKAAPPPRVASALLKANPHLAWVAPRTSPPGW